MEHIIIEKLKRYEIEIRDINHTIDFLENLEEEGAKFAIGSEHTNSSYFVPLTKDDLPDNFIEQKKKELESRVKTLESAKKEIDSIINKL